MLNRILPRTGRFHCPDEHQLAAYVDQQLIGAERERVERHLAKCDSCLQQVGFLMKESPVPPVSAPIALVLRARQLEPAETRPVFIGWKWMSAVAAIAIVAISTFVLREERYKGEENETIVANAEHPSGGPINSEKLKSEADTAVRSISPAASLPIVLSPEPGKVVHASDFTIRWEPLRNAAAYEVRVVTAEGDLVWSKRVHESSVNPPKQMLRPGLKYFVWVRALLVNGKTQQSEAVGFIGG